MRILVYTGKGGVGKTSIAAATAARLAARGQRTLVISTDAAHSLADAMDRPLGPDPTLVAPNLWGVEVDSLREAERNWGSIQRWFASLLQWAKMNEVSAEELLVFPGLEELFSLLKIREFAGSGDFDVLVVDCAPTGETLRLLSYPATMTWWLEKIFPWKKKAIKFARPVVKVAAKGLELPSDDVVDAIELLCRHLAELQTLLLNPAITTVRIVLNPEKMVLAESRRSFTYLNLFGFTTDAIIVNRALPAEATEGYLAQWRSIQAKYDEEIQAAFTPLPILRVPMMQTEVVGLPMLDLVANAAFSEVDPGAILFEGRVEEVAKEEDGFVLYLAVGFAAKDDINLTQRGDELTVQVGWHKRKVILPRTLMGRPVLGAKFAGQRLRIRFGERAEVGAATQEE
ncbi:MAG TPA: ArsA family ATPase [Symbiobacteriaceae bacterium]|nr:ArsA family ATPase [Symbiobacteriaceae bacterium]